MKANELQIGDWVINSNGKPMRYSGIFKHYDPLCESPYTRLRLMWDDNEGIDVAESYVNPLPLTEEILKANSLTHKVYCHEYDEWVIEVETHYSWWLLHIYHTVDESYDYRIEDFPISYVHELQHALRLCGLNDLANTLKVE